MTPEDLAHYRYELAHYRRYANRLTRFPDCRDPEHPGCEYCCDDEELPKEPEL